MPREYSQREVAAKVGVSYGTLGRWLRDGKVDEVEKDRNGYRIFRSDDIARVKAYKQHRKPTRTIRAGLSCEREDENGYKVASFFSGIGGFDLGFEQAGFEITFQCEVDPFCRNILRRHWPQIPLTENITKIENAEVPVSDVWVGGFPCQDLSLARMAKRDGLRGSKSRLFYEFARLVGAAKPRVFVIENVSGLLSSNKGGDFGVLLQTMAEIGYAVGWRTLNSKNFGVPQSRQRVYIVGCLGDWRGPGQILFEPKRSSGDHPSRRQNGKKSPSPFKKVVGDPSGSGPVIQSIAYCLYATSARHTGTDWSRNYVCYPEEGRVRRLTPAECEGVMAFPPEWTVPSGKDMDENSLDSARYHALGNAITPPVAYWLARRIRDYLRAAEGAEPSLAVGGDGAMEPAGIPLQ